MCSLNLFGVDVNHTLNRRRFDNVLETICLCHSTLFFLANTLVHIASRERLQDGDAALRVLTTMNYAVCVIVMSNIVLVFFLLISANRIYQ
jgi:hypothetical protein